MLSPLARRAGKRHAHRTAPCRSCRAGACGCVDGASEPPACVPPIELSSMRCTREKCQMPQIGTVKGLTTSSGACMGVSANVALACMHACMHACMQQAEHCSGTHLELEEHVQ